MLTAYVALYLKAIELKFCKLKIDVEPSNLSSLIQVGRYKYYKVNWKLHVRIGNGKFNFEMIKKCNK